MAAKVDVETVLAANREQQKHARALNVRCGETLFKVYSQTELQALLVERLVGARSIAEVADVEVLRLSSLDEEIINLVLEENPDKILVLGEELAVEYRGSEYAPRVVLCEASADGRGWLSIPDEGVKLPGGRLVEVGVSFGSTSAVASSTNMSQLKEKVREHLNSALWYAWTTKPELKAPDFAKEECFPDMLVVEYGKCVVSETPLVAYGVLVQRGYRAYQSDPYFDPKWYRSREEAEKAYTQGVAKYAELRTAVIEKEKIDGAKQVAQTLQARVKELYAQLANNYELDSQLRSGLSNRAYVSLPSTVADLEKWQEETRLLIERVETALAEVARKKEEEQAARERMTALLVREYPTCPVCGQAWMSEAGTSCFCVESMQFDEEADIVFRESRSSDGRQLVAVRLYSGRRSQSVSLEVLDDLCPELSEVTTRTLWHSPSEEEQELKRKLREVEYRLEGFGRELDKCEGEYPSRVLVKFELDGERGTLFAITNVRELSVSDTKSNDYVTVKGSVRFVCDPKRCGWLNEPPPQSGQTWICSIGRMISRDKKGRPIIVANPQMRHDLQARQAIEVEIEEIKAKIARLHEPVALPVPEATVEVAVEEAVLEVQEHVEDEQPKAAVSTDMLEALRNKFRS